MLIPYKNLLTALALGAALISCNGNGPAKEKAETAAEPGVQRLPGVTVPTFSADSAYSYIEKQLSFGPRIPNTKEHRQAGDYLIQKWKGLAQL